MGGSRGTRGRLFTAIGVALGLACLALTAFSFVYTVRSHAFLGGKILRALPLEGGVNPGKGREERAPEVRSVEPFRSVELAGPFQVHVTHGAPQSLAVDAPRRPTHSVATEVTDGRLLIGDRGFSGLGGDVDVYLTMTAVDSLEVSGSGRIIGENTIYSDSLSLGVRGSGAIAVHAESREVKSRVEGSGRITVSGTAVSHDARVGGSGRVEGFGLETERCTAEVTGSGRAFVSTSGMLDAAVSGSGAVEYRGDPEVSRRVDGSGSVTKVD